MPHITLEANMQAAPEPLFDTLDDPSARPAWQRSLRSVELCETGRAFGVGTRWRERTRLGPSFEMQIVAHERPRHWAERGKGGGVEATLAVTLVQAGEGTRLSLALSLTLPWPLLPATPVLRRLIAHELVGDLRRLDALALRRAVGSSS